MNIPPRLRIAPDCTHFLLGQTPFVYCADTVWSAITNTSCDEWTEYLKWRALQGFNVLQMNLLPQWDRSKKSNLVEPFHQTASGKWDFSSPNPQYFDKAEAMLAAAVDHGFVPALVLFWNDYFAGSWASKRAPGHEFPAEAVRPFVEYVVRRFDRFQPLYIISGDTAFESPDECEGYMKALETVKRESPRALTTLHLKPKVVIPDEFIRCPWLDFYIFQSGHGAASQANAYLFADQARAYPVKRPIINSEPCYDGHGHGRAYGRFSGADVRKAVWQSFISGANAGLAYGAHGVWSWHTEDDPFAGESFSGTPLPWREGLRLPGAWDITFARWVIEQFKLFGLLPAKLHVTPQTDEIRGAVSQDKDIYVLYVPYNGTIRLDVDLSGYALQCIDLADRRVARPNAVKDGHQSILRPHPFPGDTLWIATKSSPKN